MSDQQQSNDRKQNANGQQQSFQQHQPEFGKNYNLGWIGFAHGSNVTCRGIAHFERWSRSADISVSHCFVVSGDNRGIEANFGQGVVESNLQEMYFDNEGQMVIFRKPKGLTDDIAERIVEAARSQLGTDFDKSKVINHAMQDNFLGWLVNFVFQGRIRDLVDRIIDEDDEWLCSELAAYCLQQQPEYADKGNLDDHPGDLTPQRLFENEEVFEPLGTGDGEAAK